MYKILTIFILSTFIISCSENDSPDNSNPFPIIENISTQNVSIGEIISINGTGFYSNENYITSFNGVQGEIVEVNSNYLKVKIPQDATSGNITLSVNSQSKIIGTITINSTDIFKLYAFKGDDDSNSSIIPSIVQIDPTNGDENTIATLPEYISDLAFNSETNQIYGIAWVDHKLYTIDISNGNSTYVSLDNSVNSDSSADIFYELIIDAQNNLYAFKGDDNSNSSVIPSIVQIDPTNGNESTIATLPEYISDLALNNETNQIYGIAWGGNKLYTIDISNGNSSFVNLDSSDNSENIFYELISN